MPVVIAKAVMLVQLARLVAVGARDQPLAFRLGQACREILGVAGASVTVASATPNRVTLCVTDQISARLEELQDVLSQGPCWDAYLTGSAQMTDLGAEDDRRWPEFGPAARESVGRRIVYGLPMRPGEDVLGVLSVHLDHGELPLGVEAALFLADTVGAALLLDPQVRSGTTEAGPWAGRAQVHQATGMVVAQLRVPAADALAILRAHAYAENATLQEIAEQVINRDVNFEMDPL